MHGAATAAGVSRLARRSFTHRPLVLCYHAVCSSTPDVPDPEGLQVPKALFAEQMRFLLQRYEPIALERLRCHLAGEDELPAGAVLVTFDDGYRNVVENALPVLRGLGVPWVMFLVPALVGTQRSIWTAELEWWCREDPGLPQLKRRLKRMSQASRAEALRGLLPADARLPACDSSLCSWDEMRRWLGPGVAVGSHGLRHESLSTCDDATLERELESSRRAIEDETGSPVAALAYPNGDYSPRVIDAARRCGYEIAFTTVPRHVGRHDSPLGIPRILVGREDTIPVFESRLSGWTDWLRSA
jgi:peptidoglycan/xylan/chitin deacetylase (PgdA/CDA1 family)